MSQVFVIKYVTPTLLRGKYSILTISAEDICNPLRELSRRYGVVMKPTLSPASASRCSLTAFSRRFISVTWIVSPDVPSAEVFIGTTSGRGSGYKSVLQAPVLVHRVVSANHRISSLRQDVVESVLFSDDSGCTAVFGGISAATSSRYRRGAACGLSPKSEFWPRHTAFDGLRMTTPESIG